MRMLSNLHWARVVRWFVLGCAAAGVLLSSALGAGPTTGGTSGTPVPSEHTFPKSVHYGALLLYNAGDYKSALKEFQSAGRQAYFGIDERWIDSICYFAMEGECLYHLGEYNESLKRNEVALRLVLKYKDWMQRTEFPQAISAKGLGVRETPTWGPGTRRVPPGNFDFKVTIRQGRLDNDNVIKQGGVINPPQLLSIRATEIARCTAVAIRRRAELLGPAARHDPLMKEVAAFLATRPGQANNWSSAWVEAQLGLAYVAMGQPAQAAAALQTSLLAGGQFDHPLTGMALLELGKLAMADQKYDLAITQFHEASLAAAYFDDNDVMDEAFRGGMAAWLASGKTEIYPTLPNAARWVIAGSQKRQALHGSLLLLAAENYCVLGKTDLAAAAVQEAIGSLRKYKELAGADVGARVHHLLAMVEYQKGNATAGNAEIVTALDWCRTGSVRVYQANLVDALYQQGRLASDRVADELFEVVLRQPTSDDWALDPLESLAAQTLVPTVALEHWFEVALKRKLVDRALEISDAIRRQRFFASLPLGGRLLALRWIVSAPPEALSDKAIRQKQELLRRFPQLEALQKKSDELKALAMVAPLDDPKAAKKNEALFQQWMQVCSQQETLLRQIAVRREPAVVAFPPPLNVADLQKRMTSGQLIVSFFVSGNSLHLFALRSDKYASVKLDATEQMRRDMTALLKLLGQFDRTTVLDSAQLDAASWKAAAKVLGVSLFAGLKKEYWAGVSEVVIVPDGQLWYAPFEVLPVGPQGDQSPLCAQALLRFAPTVSLSLPDRRGQKPAGRTTVVVGRMFPRDAEEVAAGEYARLAKLVDRPHAISTKNGPGVTSQAIAALSDKIVVFDDIAPLEKGPLEWSPLQYDAQRPGSQLSQWIAFPFGGPDRVILPAFHSDAELSVKRRFSGEDLSQSVLGFMAGGARTVLISRWRTGGQSSYDLVREFAQELPHSSAAAAWQRSVSLIRAGQLDLTREPRVRESAKTDAVKAEHPFFWAGFLLADTGFAPPVDKPDPPPAKAAALPAKDLVPPAKRE